MADSRKLSTSAWLEMAAELANHLEEEDEALAFYLTFLEATDETKRVALFDRNSLDENEWRKVVLELVERVEGYEESKWKLLDVDGVTIIDEPDAGCPASGFTEKTLMEDVNAGINRVATKEEYEVVNVEERDEVRTRPPSTSPPPPRPAADADAVVQGGKPHRLLRTGRWSRRWCQLCHICTRTR